MLWSIRYYLLFLLFITSLVYPIEAALEVETNTSWYHFWEKVSVKPFQEQKKILEKYLKENPGFEHVYYKILVNYETRKDLKGAEQFFTSLAIKPECRCNSNWMLGKLYFKQKDYNKALVAFHEALKCNDPPINLLNDYWLFLKYSPVQPAINDTLFISGYDKNHQSIFYIYRDYWQSNYITAIKRIDELQQNVKMQEPILYAYGYSWISLKNFSQADSIIKVGLECAKKNQNRIYEIKFTYLSGFLYYNKTDYAKALEIFNSAATLGQALNSPEYLIVTYEFLGYLYSINQDLDNSQDYYQRAREANILYDDIENLDFYNFKIAWLRLQKGQYSQALCDFEQYELNAKEKGNKSLLIDIIHQKIVLYDALYQNEMSDLEYQKLMALIGNDAKLPYYLEIQLAGIKANIFFKRDEYDKGRAVLWPVIHQLSAKQDDRYNAWCLAVIGYSYNKQQDYGKAEYYFREAHKLSTKTLDLSQTNYYLLSVIDNMILCGKNNLALCAVDSVLKAGYDLKSTYLLRNGYLRKGQIFERIENLNEAIKNYQLSIPYTEKTLEGIREDELRIGYFWANYKVYRGLTRCYYKRYLELGSPADLDSLFYYEEIQRGRSFKDNLLETKKSHKAIHKNSAYLEACRILQEKQRELRIQAGSTYTDEQWDRIMSELEAAKYEVITQKLGAVGSLEVSKIKPPKFSSFTLRKLQKKLEKNDCGLVMYHIDEQASFALVATRDTVGVVQLSAHPDSLRKIIDRLLLPMLDIEESKITEIPFYAGLSHRLYTILYQPISKRFALPERLFIVPEGILSNLPFEILLQQEPEKPVYTPTDEPIYAKDYLQYKHAFFYSPTSAVFRQKKYALVGRKPMLIITNPQADYVVKGEHTRQFRTRTGWRFDPLPFADNEGQNIKQIEPRAQLYNHEKADEQVFLQRAQHYNIVHFATHAFVDTSFDSFSGLILSNGIDSTNDGILMGYEIKSLQLDCDLVTLSACETGRGKNVRVEGIMGLPRIFLSAGARAALVSQWKVDDRFTSMVMPEFYRNYLLKKMTRADALAQSRRIMLDTLAPAEGIHYQHPFFWGAFTLYGDPGPAAANPTPVLLLVLIVIITIFIVTGWYLFRHNKKI